MNRLPVPRSGLSRRGLLVGAALIATPFAVRSRGRSVDPRPAPQNRNYPTPHYLISVAGLYRQIVDDRLRVQILDASELADYRFEHIMQARHVWWQDTMELNAPFYGMVLKPDDDQGNQGRRVRFLERLHLSSEQPVVVYDRGDGQAAARVAWFLTFLGLTASVLDGGLAAWKAQPGPTTSDVEFVSDTPTAFVTPQQGFYLSAEQIANRYQAPGFQLVDLRENAELASDEFAGATIPGAIRQPRSSFRTADGLVLPPDALATLLQTAGLDLQKTILLIGPTGIDCSVPWLALSLAGAKTVTICDGGWLEWTATPGLPLG